MTIYIPDFGIADRYKVQAGSRTCGKRYAAESKYKNEKITRMGETFDSIKECERWCQLRLLERGKAISDLQRQVKFELLPAQKDADGKVIERAVSYVADFTYVDKRTGEFIAEDTKGFKTKEYILKRKMMLYFHGIVIREV